MTSELPPVSEGFEVDSSDHFRRSQMSPDSDQIRRTQVSPEPVRRASTALDHNRRASQGPNFRSSSALSNHLDYTSFDEDARYRTMAKYLYGRISNLQWIDTSPQRNSEDSSGVLIRKNRGVYITAPEEVTQLLTNAIRKINAEVAFTMRSETVDVILSTLSPEQTDLIMTDNSQLQVMDSLEQIAATNVKKFQYGCLVRQERLILVWHDDLQQILPHAAQLEEKLLSMIWGTTMSPFSVQATPLPSAPATRPASPTRMYNIPVEEISMKKLPLAGVSEVEEYSQGDLEKMELSPESLARPVLFTSAVFVGCGVCLVITLLCGFATSKLIVECLIDGKWIRMALCVTIPFLIAVALFFTIVIFTDISQAIGPIGGLQSNSRNFSAIKPDLKRAYSQGFTPPHITIQMPVYKEGLEGVIMPTVRSLKAAISHYESHGGTASIFINDDGMASMEETEAQQRIDFYHDNNIGWIARPKDKDNGYVRKGKFKKASNMNFALNASQKVEGYLQDMIDAKILRDGHDMVDEQEEEQMYRVALKRVLDEDHRVRGEGNIRMGEFILIVDSDTRIPTDCLLYGAAEMFLSPEVAIVQHSTSVMQVVGDYFENGITYFTNMVYTAIKFSVGCGEVAAFVGHNGFLRWQAVQSVGRDDPDGDGYIAYWSESHVSEDFDIALRLQIAGNVVRCASYHGDGFKEGVSLTIYDELARWEKYAYGCSELMFNPMKYWLWRGPFTPLFRTFFWCDMILSSKCTIMAYICSYFALASGATFTFANYFLIGWFNGNLDKYYMESWNVFVSLIVVFNVGGNLCLAILRYRLGEKGLLASIFENFKWMPMFTIFFGGLSFHLTCAIGSHLLGINMQWGATSKEKENSNFFKELPKIFKNFKWMYLCVIAIVGGMIYLGCFAPRGWDIKGATAIVPLAVTLGSHALVPFVLNPSLMIFSY